MKAARKKKYLPDTYRAGLTVESPEYKAHVRCEMEQLRRADGKGEALARLESILYRSGSHADGFDILPWRMPDGEELYVSRWMAPDPRHVIVYVNGLESHGGWFSEVAGQLADAGTAVYALDRRGSGLNVRSVGTYRDWIADLAAVANGAKKDCPGVSLHVVSSCFGAAVATAFAIQHPCLPDSLIYFSPGLRVKVHPTMSERLRIGLSVLPGVAESIPSPVRADEMFTDTDEGLWFLHRDKLRTVAPRAEDFLQGRRIISRVRQNLHLVKVPSIVFLAGRDQVVDNAATRRTFMRFAQKPKFVEYPESEHIIFLGPAKQALVADVRRFIEQGF